LIEFWNGGLTLPREIVSALHHVGISVSDLSQAVDAAASLGFASSGVIHASGDGASRGNGIPNIDMRVAFVSDGLRTIELIEHHNVGAGRPPEVGTPGHQEWIFSAPREADTIRTRFDGLPVVQRHDQTASTKVVLTTPDPEATAAFLILLGLKLGSPLILSATNVDVELAQSSNTGLTPRANDIGRSHLAFLVDDLDEAFSTLGTSGITCISSPITHDETLRWMFVKDPGGSGEIELIEARA
jgi:catechol 2,3-dioxygenase-like lactoylglutathione lyase family enzyme